MHMVTYWLNRRKYEIWKSDCNPCRPDRLVIRLSGHTKYSTYYWNQTDGEESIAYQDIANANFQLSFTGWDIAVMQNAGITLGDLGFTSYE